MALSFPASPTIGQTSSQNGRQYTWSGYAWELSGTNISPHASTHSSGASDAVTIQTSQISDLAAGANAAARMYLWQTFR